MRNIGGIRRGLVAGVGLSLLLTAGTAPPIRFEPESRIWVEGTSTVRSYTCRATRIEGTVGGDGSLAVSQLQTTIRDAEVNVSVSSLECGNGTMNEHMRNALKASENPSIQFRMDSHQVYVVTDVLARVQFRGAIRIAGQERPFTAEATVSREADGATRISGSKEILMSEFGVRPPTLMMGTLRVRDRVQIFFDVLLRSS